MEITDAGEILPYAKKMLVSSEQEHSETKEIEGDDGSDLPQLSELWPEPKWKELSTNHPCPEALLRLMYIYKAIPKVPNTSVRHKNATKEQAIQGYIEIVTRFAKINPLTQTIETIEKACELFSKIYHAKDKLYAAIAAGKVSGRTVYYFPVLREKHKMLARVLARLGWPEKVSEKDIEYLPIKLTCNERSKTPNRVFYVIGKYFKNNVSYLRDEYNSLDEAISEVKRRVEIVKGPLDKEAEPEPETPPFEPKKKELPKNYHIVLGVTPQDLIDTFGFRGVQFGNYLTEKDRQRFTDNTYAAFIALSNLLGFPEKNIANNLLGIAFGARGSGNASAHYEPNLAVINLTKYNGGGSVAHEYFHAFDNLLSRYCGFDDKLYSEIDFYDLQSIDLDEQLINAKKLFNYVTSQPNYIMRSKNISAQKRAPKYWSKTCELLARAFESYIEDKLEEQGINCPWLVYGTVRGEMEACEDTFFPYPEGIERRKINAAFDKYFKSFKFK